MRNAARLKQAPWNHWENLYGLGSGALSPVTFQGRNFWRVFARLCGMASLSPLHRIWNRVNKWDRFRIHLLYRRTPRQKRRGNGTATGDAAGGDAPIVCEAESCRAGHRRRRCATLSGDSNALVSQGVCSPAITPRQPITADESRGGFNREINTDILYRNKIRISNKCLGAVTPSAKRGC